MRSVIFMLVISLVLPVQGAIYKWVDEQGVVQYSDQARGGAEQIKLPEPSIYRPPERKTGASSARQATPYESEQPLSTGAVVYQGLNIIKPVNGGTLRSSSGQVQVLLEILPALAPGHSLKLYLDGKEVASGVTASEVMLDNVQRGAHTLYASVIDSGHQLRISSASVRFHLHRHRDKVQDHIKLPADNQRAFIPGFEQINGDNIPFDGGFDGAGKYPRIPQGGNLYPGRSDGTGQFPPLPQSPDTFDASPSTYAPNYNQN